MVRLQVLLCCVDLGEKRTPTIDLGGTPGRRVAGRGGADEVRCSHEPMFMFPGVDIRVTAIAFLPSIKSVKEIRITISVRGDTL